MYTNSDLNLRRTLIFLLSVFVVISVGCASEDQQQEDQDDEGVAVSVATVRTQNLQETTQAIGSLQADKVVRVRPEISGTIESIGFAEGDTVAEGQTLFELDDDRLRQQVQGRQSSLDEAKAQLTNARRTYQRQQRLFEKDLTSGQERDNALEAFETAKARVSQLEAQLAEAREQLEDATIKAPFSGVIGSHEVDEGNYVQPGQLLTTLYRTARLKVNFTVPERFSGRVRQGQTIRVHVNSLPEETFTGKVYYVSPSVREQTRDLMVKAYINNSERTLKPGMYSRVELVLETLQERPVIPAQALVATNEGYVVYRVEDGVARRQPVTIGLRQPGRVEIKDGLMPADRVVESGHMALSDGMDVQVQDENQSSES